MAKNIDIGGRLHSVATEHVVAGANEIQDDTLNKTQAQLNEEVNTTLEMYGGLIEGLSSQNYESYTATDETTEVTDVLPDLGAVNTVYRLGNWDGTQYNTTQYAEYAWITTGIDQGNYVLLDVKNYGIDDTPTTGSNNLVKSGGVADKISQLGQYVDNTEWARVVTDSNGKILYGVKTDGKFYFGDGCPPQIKDYLISKYNLERIAIFLGSLPNDLKDLTQLLFEKVDKVDGKSLINSDYASSQNAIENNEWLIVWVDASNKIVGGVRKNGVWYINQAIFDSIETQDIHLGESGLNHLRQELKTTEEVALEVPEYYKAYLASRVKEINDYRDSLEGYSDAFIFFTDIHVSSNNKKSPQLIEYLLKNTSICKVFFGGDIASAFGDDNMLRNTAQEYIRLWYKRIAPNAKIYDVMGNHDFNYRTSASAQTGNTFSLQYTRNVLMAGNDADNEIVMDGISDAIYYYVDNKHQKIRYIVVNTTDTVREGEYWGWNYTFSKPQSDFVADAVNSCPSGYKVVFIGHASPVSPLDNSEIESLNDFLAAVKNKTSVTVNSTEYDFSQAPDMLLYLNGHWHFDCVKPTEDGVPVITTACDASFEEYLYSIFNEDAYPSKRLGTITEQTFDVVVLDIENNTMKMFRIGGGFDRIVNLATVDVSGTETLTSQLNNPVWRIADYDSINVYDSGEDAYIWGYNHNVATIDSATGEITAVGSGYAVACAVDTSAMQMEYFFIHIS